MDKTTLKIIKEKLQNKKEQLEVELAKFTKKDVQIKGDYKAVFPSFGDKEDENAAEVAAYSDNLSLEQNLELTLRDVNSALERIKKGDYGTCRHCQKPISQERLLARPESSSCVACKKRLSGKK